MPSLHPFRSISPINDTTNNRNRIQLNIHRARDHPGPSFHSYASNPGMFGDYFAVNPASSPPPLPWHVRPMSMPMGAANHHPRFIHGHLNRHHHHPFHPPPIPLPPPGQTQVQQMANMLKVWILDCKSCGTFLTNRGMKVRRLVPPLFVVLMHAFSFVTGRPSFSFGRTSLSSQQTRFPSTVRHTLPALMSCIHLLLPPLLPSCLPIPTPSRRLHRTPAGPADV